MSPANFHITKYLCFFLDFTSRESCSVHFYMCLLSLSMIFVINLYYQFVFSLSIFTASILYEYDILKSILRNLVPFCMCVLWTIILLEMLSLSFFTYCMYNNLQIIYNYIIYNTFRHINITFIIIKYKCTNITL